MENRKVSVPEDENEMSKEIKNVAENSIGKSVDKTLEVEVIKEVKYQVTELGENEEVEERKSEVSFHDEDSD